MYGTEEDASCCSSVLLQTIPLECVLLFSFAVLVYVASTPRDFHEVLLCDVGTGTMGNASQSGQNGGEV